MNQEIARKLAVLDFERRSRKRQHWLRRAAQDKHTILNAVMLTGIALASLWLPH